MNGLILEFANDLDNTGIYQLIRINCLTIKNHTGDLYQFIQN